MAAPTKKQQLMAKVAHEVNRAFQGFIQDPDPSPPWETAPADQVESTIAGVQAALAGATPEELHQSWMDTKRDAGWVYGAVKDATAKTHPCLVPYDQLPGEQRVKDTLFHAVINALR